jgi:hypothetical protein
MIHRTEVGSAEPARFVDLSEKYFLGRAQTRAPAADMPLQGSQLVVRKPPRLAPLQLLENRLGLEAGIGFKELAHLGPDLLEGIGASAPGVRLRGIAGPFAEVPVFACGLLVHVCPPRRPC